VDTSVAGEGTEPRLGRTAAMHADPMWMSVFCHSA